jgi:hypothetical protein
MAVNPSPLGPKPQFELADGTPAVGNLLFFYVAGSVSTKQNTYTDSTGGSANANPIVLNALGQPTTQIWFTAGQSYKVVYAPSTDSDPPTSPIWTIDNLLGINDTTSSQSEWVAGPSPTFISATQFSLVGDQTGTFTVGRRVRVTETAGTAYGRITASAFAALTTVTVQMDGTQTLDSGLSAVSYGLLSSTVLSIPDRVATASGTDTYTATVGVTRLVVGDEYKVKIANANTSTTPTLNLDGIGAKTIIRQDGAALTAGDLNGEHIFRWNGTNMVAVGVSSAVHPAAFKNKLINPDGDIYQRAVAATADDTYFADRWYILTQTNTVTPSVLTDPEDGFPKGVRITQSQAVAQRFGYAQIILGRNCKNLRGKSGVFVPRIRASSSQAIRYAILGWTSTENAVTSDVVLDWTSSTYTAGNFFLAANLSVLVVGAQTPSANTWTSLTPITAALGSSFNNIVVMVWTEGTAAQNFTLDFDFNQFEQGSVATEFDRRDRESEIVKCQAYMEKSWGIDTPVGTASNTDATVLQSVATAADMGNRSRQTISYKVSKISSATVTFYDMAGTSGRVTTVSNDAFTNNVVPAVGTFTAGLERFAMQMNGEEPFILHWTAIAEL